MKRILCIVFLLLQPIFSNVFADDIMHQYTPTGYTSNVISGASSSYSASASVTRVLTASGALKSIQLLLAQNTNGNPVTVYICKGETYECDWSGQDANRIYTSSSFSISSFGFSYDGRNETLELSSPVALVNGQNYSIQVKGDGVYWWTAPGTSEPFDVLRRIVLTLGSPLSGAPTISGGYHFNTDWTISGTKCPTDPGGVWKKHTGSDFVASATADVFAAEAGTVKHVQEHSPWASHVVIEHTHSDGWKYTTVYWHVDSLVAENDTVTKGQHIADVANITGAHLHFGVWIGDYVTYGENGPAVGALPVGDCSTWPAFPGAFISPENTNYVQFE